MADPRIIAMEIGQATREAMFRDAEQRISTSKTEGDGGTIKESLIDGVRPTAPNRSGDCLALDDFMNTESLADLIDFVCDESAIRAFGVQPTGGVKE